MSEDVKQPSDSGSVESYGYPSIGTRVEVRDGSEAHGDCGYVLHTRDGLCLVELDAGCVWSVSDPWEIAVTGERMDDKKGKPMKKITEANLGSCTEQEVFDYVAHHLLTQATQALRSRRNDTGEDSPKRCTYRTDEGLSCAVGCMFSDDFIEVLREEGHLTRPWGIIRRYHNLEGPDRLLDNLQHVHDLSEPEHWKKLLRKVAKNFGLEWKYEEFKYLPKKEKSKDQ